MAAAGVDGRSWMARSHINHRDEPAR